MVVMPDVMTAVDTATAQIRDLQGKMIAHCENMGDRMAILDAPPDLLPQDVLEWRMNTAGYDSKMAALYYPWIEVMDPLTKRPIIDPAVGPRRRRLVPRRRDPRRPQGARRTRSSWAPTGSASRSRRPSRAASTRSASTASARSPAAASASGARARCRATRSGATSTSAGSSTTSPSRSWRARSGACSSPTTSGCGLQLRIAASNFLTRTWRDGRAVRRDADAGLLRQVRRGDQPARGDRGRAGRLRDRHRAR